MLRFIFFAFCVLIGTTVMAQTAPSPGKIAAYDGLFKAAHHGDVAVFRQFAFQGADVNARDAAVRTPIHVAAFASEDEALRALAEAGADMNALEHQAYDVVTIAAVADDPELMSLAIELGNDPGLVTSVYNGTALIAAAHLGHGDVVRRLIMRARRSITSTTCTGRPSWKLWCWAMAARITRPCSMRSCPQAPAARWPTAMASHRFSMPRRVGSQRWWSY